KRISGARIAVHGEPQQWERIEARFAGSQLSLSSLVRREPFDKFSKLILGMHNFFARIETPSARDQEFVLRRIANAEMLIGITAQPSFRSDDGHLKCVAAIAECLDALIFTGTSMLTADGRVILNGAPHR